MKPITKKGEKLRLASLFSGIGGIELGFEKEGFVTTIQCEIDDFCLTILKKNWPSVQKRLDIRELTNAEIPFSEVWSAGFPCQDVSLARMGKRPGLKGTRSGLFYEFARLVKEGLPRVIFLENVHGLLNSHKGRDFEIVVRTLAKLGYSIGWRVLNSKNFGVPQSRRRVYIIGCYRDRRGPGKILFEPECSEGNSTESKPYETSSLSPFKRVFGDPSGEGPVVQGVAYCLYACSARHTGTDWSRTYVTYPKKGRVRRLTPGECEAIMGFPEGWTIPQNGIFKTDDIDSKRYQALGNAVTPPVIAWIAKRIKNYINKQGD